MMSDELRCIHGANVMITLRLEVHSCDGGAAIYEERDRENRLKTYICEMTRSRVADDGHDV